jgi:hypothetical protein
VALCAPEVPCGAAAEQVFAAAGVTPAPDTLEQDVRAALAKVVLGEVDAALVYRTDVLAPAPTSRGVAFPEADAAVNDYPVVTLADAPNAGRRRGLRGPRPVERRAAGPCRRRLRAPLSGPAARAGRPPAQRDGRGSGLPPVLLLPAALALAFLVLPLLALLLRAPWSTLPERLLSPAVGSALRLSLVCASSATLVCLVLGVPLAWVLARAEFPGRRLVRALVTVPWCCRPSSAAWHCCCCSAAEGWSASTSTAGSASPCPSPPLP